MAFILLFFLLPITATALMVNLTTWPVFIVYLPVALLATFVVSYFACFMAITMDRMKVVQDIYEAYDEDDDTPPKDYQA